MFLLGASPVSSYITSDPGHMTMLVGGLMVVDVAVNVG